MSKRANNHYEFVCAHCGAKFVAGRRGVRFCSQKCRDKYRYSGRKTNATRMDAKTRARLAARDAAYDAAFPSSGPVRFSWRAKAGCDVDADMVRRWA